MIREKDWRNTLFDIAVSCARKSRVYTEGDDGARTGSWHPGKDCCDKRSRIRDVMVCGLKKQQRIGGNIQSGSSHGSSGVTRHGLQQYGALHASRRGARPNQKTMVFRSDDELLQA